MTYLTRTKTFIFSAITSAILAGCGGGGSGTVVLSTGVSTPEVMTPQQAADLKSIDNSILPGHARFIVQVNPAIDMADSTTSTGETPSVVGLQMQALRAGLNLDALKVVHKDILPATNSFISEVPLENQEAYLLKLKQDPRVVSVVADQIVRSDQTTIDPLMSGVSAYGLSTFPYSAQYWWYLDRIDQKALPLDSKYTNTYFAKNVKAYVMDTGVSPHAELTSVSPGYSAIADSYGTKDCNGHGTAVSSQIAGVNLGVVPGTPIVPVRVMGCTGSGLVSDIFKGYDWVLANGTLPAVVNMSFGTTALTQVDTYVQKLIDRGFTVVAAAGNDNRDACLYSPARVSSAISVGATTKLDARASFSNYGRCVSIFAPGESVMAASYNVTNGYVLASGTSFSAPMTAGAAAAILQLKPGWAPSSVKAQLIAQSSKSVVKNSASTTSNLVYAVPTSLASTANAQNIFIYAMPAVKTVVTSTTWKQVVTPQVKNNAGALMPGVQIIGYFSNSATPVTCTTASNGSCSIASAVATNSSTITFTVDTLRGTNTIYKPTLNKIVSIKS